MKVDHLLFVVIIILILGILAMGFLAKYEYKLGQIDAINGKIYYELQEMDNGEMKWRRIEEATP